MGKIKRILLLIGILLSVSPNLVLANVITLDQDFGEIDGWDEHKYVVGDDLYVDSHVRLSLSWAFYNYSDNYTFEFSPLEPGYVEEPVSYSVRIFRNCNQISLQYFLPTYVNCKRGEELMEGTDFQDIEVNQWSNMEQKAHKIRIFQNDSFRERVGYDILISYKLENFVKKKGSDRYFSLSKVCRNIGTEKGCPQGNPVRETVFFTNPNFKLEKYPDCAKEKRFRSDGGEYIWIEGVYKGCEIRFSDVKETETWIPFKWAAIGAFMGAIIGSILVPLFTSVFRKIKPKK